jgi:hypothetical protein
MSVYTYELRILNMTFDDVLLVKRLLAFLIFFYQSFWWERLSWNYDHFLIWCYITLKRWHNITEELKKTVKSQRNFTFWSNNCSSFDLGIMIPSGATTIYVEVPLLEGTFYVLSHYMFRPNWPFSGCQTTKHHSHDSTGTHSEATYKTVSKRHIHLTNNSNIPLTLI